MAAAPEPAKGPVFPVLPLLVALAIGLGVGILVSTGLGSFYVVFTRDLPISSTSLQNEFRRFLPTVAKLTAYWFAGPAAIWLTGYALLSKTLDGLASRTGAGMVGLVGAIVLLVVAGQFTGVPDLDNVAIMAVPGALAGSTAAHLLLFPSLMPADRRRELDGGRPIGR